MENERPIRSPRQELFREMVLGTLIYAVVLGFFNDYTDILSTTSYSTTFFVAIVMQILTYLTFGLKKIIIRSFKGKEGAKHKVAMGFFVWLVMFFSKFVFLAVIDVIFGQAVEISGFIGLVAIILIMTVSKKLIDIIYDSLA